MKAFGITGSSGSGKTTLLEDLIPRFVRRGLKVSLIKHTHHRFDVDQPGKDSWRLREAGCHEVLLVSDQRWVLMHELRGAAEPPLEEQLARMAHCDLVLVEGFKQAPMPKLEVFRPAIGKPLLAVDPARHIVAVASDGEADIAPPIARLDLNDRAAIFDFILRYNEL